MTGDDGPTVRERDGGERSLPGAPSRVQVTVVPGPRGAIGRRRLRRVGGASRARAAIALVTVVAAVSVASAIALGARPGGGTGAPAPGPAVSQPGAALAAIYRYPLGCLSVSMSVAESAKLARLRRAGPCWRYGVFITAILRRVGDDWRLALEATSPSCPALSLPPEVEAQVVVCRRPGPNG